MAENGVYRMSEAARRHRRLLESQSPPPTEAATLPMLRRQAIEAARPLVEEAVSQNGVRVSEVEIGGVTCSAIDPEDRRSGDEMVYLFGGGFVQGSAFEDLMISAPLARLTRSRIIAPHYRLAPEHPFPAGLDDALAVVSALSEGGAAPRVIGESAGGNLALAVTHRLRRLGADGPRALALMSPACELGRADDAIELGLDPTLTLERVKTVAGLYASGRDLEDPEISPIHGAFDARFPPCFITTGTRDLFLSQCARLASVVRAQGGRADLRVWDGLWHVFEYYPDLPEAAASLEEIAAFLREFEG
ncbi:MAG: alpha/beta hydrolase [Alphaproteobacteria bacterium]|nr:alpha/beta hydrolase [Alphaproteobacteria bacterium]